MRSVKKLFFTTLALTLTGLFMRTVGVWFNVYLAGLIGTGGIGVFQLILSVYALSKTFAYAGMNLGATRLCIENKNTARHSMRRVLLCAALMGLFANLVLYFTAPFLSVKWIDAPDAVSALRILSFSLPFVSLSAGLNGYMTAVRKLSRYSLIQLAEQMVKIAFTICLIHYFSNGSREKSLFLVGLGITLSEIVSFSLCLVTYLRDVVKNHMKKNGNMGFFRRFFRVAVPDAIGSYVRSALNTIEHLLIPWGIRRSGSSTENSFSAYGIVQGMALPVLLYPSAILGVISSLLVPEIAECKVKNNQVEIRYMINRVLQITTFFSLAVATAVFLYAEQISESVFHSLEAAPFLRILSPLIPVMYMDMTTDGMLKGLDKQLSLMKINVLDSVMCVALVYFLVPKIAVNGYLITIYAAEIINFLLSFKKLRKETDLSLNPIKNVIYPTLLSVFSFQSTRLLFTFIKNPTLGLIAACGVGLMIFLILLRVAGCIAKEDVRWAKKLVKPLSSSGSQSGATRLRSSSVSDPG